jgi:glutathione peroxidase
LLPVAFVSGILAMFGLGRASVEPADSPATPPAEGTYVLGYTMNRIDGTPEALETYKGKVVLMVNVASKCGLTGQYEGLEALFKEHAEAGLVVLGFPANDFLGQEPGSNEQIAEFCSTKYGVTFPMFEKITVKGDKAHPLYLQLAREMEDQGGQPSWNFTKYLVDRSGNVVARFDPRTKPDDDRLVARIKELLDAAP